MENISQGEILSVERINNPVLVVSKDYFNRTGQIIGCPIVKNAPPDPLHISVQTDEVIGIVLCEQMKMMDLSVRGHSKLSELQLNDIMNITDAIQSIFDYYPFGM